MSSDITQTKQFKSFVAFNAEETNIAESDSAEKTRANISQMAQKVIDYLGDTTKKSLDNIPEFIAKLSTINDQFSEHGDGTPFATSLTALNLLLSLRTHLSDGNQKILEHSFFKQLDELLNQDDIEDKLSVARNLYQFQQSCLIPAIQGANSQSELKALQPVLRNCFLLVEKVSSVDPKGKLADLKEAVCQNYNYKSVTLDRRYGTLIAYEKGRAGNLEDPERRTLLVKSLTELIGNFTNGNITEMVSKSDQAALYDAILTIQDELEEHGEAARLEPVRSQLAEAVGAIDSIRSGFPIELRELAASEPEGARKPILEKLVAFEKDILTPALANVSTIEELLALEPLVDQCIALKPKVEELDADKELDASHRVLLDQWNAKHYQKQKVHTFLTSYERGNFPSIEESPSRDKYASAITKHITALSDKISHPTFKTHEKRDLYQALLTIQDELEEYGAGAKLDTAIQTLGDALGLPTGMKSAFPIELADLAETTLEPSQKPHVLNRLVAFENDILMPAMARASSEELEAHKALLVQCHKLQAKLTDVEGKERLSATHEQAIALYEAKKQHVKNAYDFLRTYTPGKIPKLDQAAKREAADKSVNAYLEELIPHLGNPIFSTEDKRAILQGIQTLQKDFGADGKRLDPIIKKYKQAIGVRELPQSPTRKAEEIDRSRVSSIRDMWQNKSSSSTDSIGPVVSERSQKVETPEEKRVRYTGNIKKSLALLDLDNSHLRENIAEIKRQIALVRKLPDSSPTELQQLEQALNLLIRPDELMITREEGRFIELIAAKHKAGDALDYQSLERGTVRDSQSKVLAQLKRDFSELPRLESRASRVLRGLKEETAQNRFERFRDSHTFNPPLSKHFATHYPALLNAFTLYSDKIAVDGLLLKWDEIKVKRDKATKEKFSPLIEEFYSHTDPSQHVPMYTAQLQEVFVNGLDLSKIDNMREEQLVSYLVKEIESLIEVPGKWFEGFYASSYGAQHDWLTANIDRIIRPYNQGDTPDTNLGAGVCYNNSLQVQRAFLEGPVSSSTILLGSNETTRYHQSRYKSQHAEVVKLRKEYAEASEAYKKGTVSLSALKKLHDKLTAANQAYTQLEAELPSVYGLKLHASYTLPSPPAQTSLQDHLANTIEQWSTQGHKQVVLVLRSPTAGHAVNLQFDNTRGVYRLRDDNKGIIEFEDMHTMKREISSYFKAFYSDYNQFIFESYTKA